jgi:hypothetical protein
MNIADGWIGVFLFVMIVGIPFALAAGDQKIVLKLGP